MTEKNRYFRFSKISEAKFRQILRCFALDLTAGECAALTGISVRSLNPIYLRIHERMAAWCAARSPFCGELEADASYFGPRRVRGKRGRGAGGKTIVFGRLKRDDCVYTEIVPNASRRTLQAISRKSECGQHHPYGWLAGVRWPGGYRLRQAFPGPSQRQ